MKDYIKELVTMGYVSETGVPLKCMACNCEDLKFDWHSHIEGIATECEVTCNNCGHITGNYYCGAWEI